MKKNIYSILAILSIGLFFLSCEDDRGNAIPERTKYVTEGAFIKLYNHVQASPQVNFYLNERKITAATTPNAGFITRGLPFGSTFPSTYGYVSVPSGNFNLSVIDTITYVTTIASVHPKSLAVELARTEVKLEEGGKYSAFLVGTPAIGTTPANYQLLITNDDLPAPDFSKIYFRFIQTMANAPFNFDVYAFRPAVAATPTTPAKENLRIPIATNVGFKEKGIYVELPLDSYRFEFYRAGTNITATPAPTPYLSYPATTTSTVTPALGHVYSVFLRGTYSSPGVVASHVDFWRER